jgi:hypothetical protein
MVSFDETVKTAARIDSRKAIGWRAADERWRNQWSTGVRIDNMPTN